MKPNPGGGLLLLRRKAPLTRRSVAYFCSGAHSEVVILLKAELSRLSASEVQPVLLDVKQTAIYLGRSEQSVQHLIFEKELPVVRKGRRVHLHRHDLDAWIEKNKY